jgi:hypothetical protein
MCLYAGQDIIYLSCSIAGGELGESAELFHRKRHVAIVLVARAPILRNEPFGSGTVADGVRFTARMQNEWATKSRRSAGMAPCKIRIAAFLNRQYKFDDDMKTSLGR